MRYLLKYLDRELKVKNPQVFYPELAFSTGIYGTSKIHSQEHTAYDADSDKQDIDTIFLNGRNSFMVRAFAPFIFIALTMFISCLVLPSTQSFAATFYNAPINPNFTADGNYLDTGLQLMINYNGSTNDNFYGNSVDIFGVHYGGAIRGPPDLWNYSTTNNPDGSTNYHLTSMMSFVDIKPGSPIDFTIDWASENGNPVPAGIGSEALIPGSINTEVGYAGGEISTGSMPSPYSIANGPAVVPEPVSSTLFLLGIAALGARRLLRRKQT